MENEKLEKLERKLDDIYSLIADLNISMDRFEDILRGEHKKDIVTMPHPIYIEKPVIEAKDKIYENVFMKTMLKNADLLVNRKRDFKLTFVEHYRDESLLYARTIKKIADEVGKQRASMSYLFSFLYLDFNTDIKYKSEELDKMIVDQNNKMSNKNSGRVNGVFMISISSMLSPKEMKNFMNENGVKDLCLGTTLRALQERIVNKMEAIRKILDSYDVSLEPVTVDKMIQDAARKSGITFEDANNIREVVVKSLMNNYRAFDRNPNFTTGFLMLDFEDGKQYTESGIGRMLKEKYEDIFCKGNRCNYVAMRFAHEKVDTSSEFGLQGIYKRAIFAVLSREEVIELRDRYDGYGLAISGLFYKKLQEKIREKLGLTRKAA